MLPANTSYNWPMLPTGSDFCLPKSKSNGSADGSISNGSSVFLPDVLTSASQSNSSFLAPFLLMVLARVARSLSKNSYAFSACSSSSSDESFSSSYASAYPSGMSSCSLRPCNERSWSQPPWTGAAPGHMAAWLDTIWPFPSNKDSNVLLSILNSHHLFA